MALQTIPNDMYVDGNLSSKTFNPASGSITNASVQALAGIAASKLQHRYRPGHAQVHGSAATAERRVIHVVRGATATINSMRAGVVVAAIGDSTASVNLYKNGSSILSGGTPITLSSADAALLSIPLAGLLQRLSLWAMCWKSCRPSRQELERCHKAYSQHWILMRIPSNGICR